MGLKDLFSFKKDFQTIDMTGGKDQNQESGFVSNEGSTGAPRVDEETAMKIASLHQGINIIADTIASMPVYLHKENDGFQQTLFEDSRCKILSGMANEVLTSFNLKRNLIKDIILYGNAYAKIVREGERVSLYYLPTDVVNVKKDNTGYYFEVKSYSTDVMGERTEAEIVDYYDMLVLIRNPKHNSIKGVGLLEYATNVIAMSTHESDYMINLFRNGLSAKAVLNSKTPFKKEVKEQLKRDLQSFYSGYSNAGKMMVLEGDISVLPLSLTPADIKLIENSNFSITQIARFLNIQKHLLNLDRGQGTYSNITQERLMLLQNTLLPYCVAIEEALNQKLLSEEEINQGYYFQFNTSEMLKLTPEDNAKYVLELYRENVVTLEEVRATLNLGGDTEIIEELKQYQAIRLNRVKNEMGSEDKESAASDSVVEEETSSEDIKPNEKV